MAKKKTKATPEPTVESEWEEVAAAEDVAEVELQVIDTGDMIKLKQVLDEGTAAALLQYLPEDYKWDNTKLLIMFTACVFAMIAQFVPIPFPESRPVLGVCGSLYFVMSGILQLITTFIDKDAILWTVPIKEESPKFKNKLLYKYGLRVSSNLPRFSEFFTVKIEFQIKDETSDFVEETWSVGKFFDKEGFFDEVGLGEEVDKLFDRFNAGKYDKSKAKSD